MTAPALTLTDRALGAYLGFAIGDALGATVEFMTAREIAATFRGGHRHIVGGGWLHLKPGQITDDTQMALALGDALLAARGWDLTMVADSFVGWMRSKPPDIGHACRRGIRRYLLEGTLSAPPADDNAGNGAAMRNLPVVLATLAQPPLLARCSLEQARITHHHPLSDAATLLFAELTRHLLLGASIGDCRRIVAESLARHPQFRFEPWPGNTSGFVVDTVQTVLHAFFRSDSVEACVTDVVNRGGDADTAGALAGQLAGACYGLTDIPPRWLKQLDRGIAERIRRQTAALLALPKPLPLRTHERGTTTAPQPLSAVA
ncbi:MAG TPA: ADP-ribosyl-[dinitrogen reductase] hydrolase [Opitutaceae bacterium]|nr:ADP-ribosyl-[dinitrogen reductase] hydrolase [Opitutaceae bacterium]